MTTMHSPLSGREMISPGIYEEDPPYKELSPEEALTRAAKIAYEQLTSELFTLGNEAEKVVEIIVQNALDHFYNTRRLKQRVRFDVVCDMVQLRLSVNYLGSSA